MPLERPQSAWLDFLDWVKDPAQTVLNADRPAVAGRFLADFLAGPIDAVVPGDLIDTAPLPGDRRDVNPVLEAAVNPLTWTALIPGAGKLVGRALQAGGSKLHAALPAPVQSEVGSLRRTLGWDDYGEKMVIPAREATLPPPEGWVAPMDPTTKLPIPYPKTQIPEASYVPTELLQKAKGIEQTSATAQQQDIAAFLKRAGAPTPEENQILSDAIQNLDFTKGGRIPEVLDPLHTASGRTRQDLANAAKSRVSMLISKGMRGDEAKLHRLVDEHYQHTGRQLEEGIQRRALDPGQVQGDYIKRLWTGALDKGGGSDKRRSLDTAQKVIDFLKVNPDVDLERDYVKSLMRRADSQGSMLKRAYLRDKLVGPELSRALLQKNAPQEGTAARALYEEAQQAKNAAMEAAVPGSDLWHRLRFELEGAVPQGKLADVGRSINRVFKGAAVYGTGPFVKVGSIARNQLTGLWQLAGTPEGRSYLIRNPTAAMSNILGAFDDGVVKNLGFKRLNGSELTKQLDAIEAAAQASGGKVDTMVANLRAKGLNDAADAVENGVTQGFIMSEDMAKDALLLREHVNPLTWVYDTFVPGRSARANIGAKVFGGLEQRMRLGAFVDFKRQLIQSGVPESEAAAKAAKKAADIFLDYDVSGEGNRNMRAIFPFAQFVVKTAQQQGRILRDNPAIIPAVGALYGGDDLPDYARQQAHVGTVLPGFAPTDVFNVLPDFTGSGSFESFRQSAKPLVGAAHPLIGAGIGVASGVDTFTGRQYLQDARLPGRDPTSERNAADLAYGLAEDIGVLQPFAGPVQQAKSLGKMDPGPAALRFATGVNVLQPKPEIIESQRLQATLSADPRVRSFDRLYTKSQDSDLVAALKRLEEVRRELKQKADSVAATPTPFVP